jgi:Domain of unknown function (DUF4253)
MNNASLNLVRDAGTNAGNYDLDVNGIVQRLEAWHQLCDFKVVSAEADSVQIEFQTLPADMDEFVRGLYQFCPDLVDQGTRSVIDQFGSAENAPENARWLVEGLDFADPNAALEILKRQVERKMKLKLWWD